MGRAFIEMELGHMRFKLNNEQVIFNVCQSMRQSDDMRVMYVIDTINNKVDTTTIPIEERLVLKH